MKLLNLLNEVRYKTVLKNLEGSRHKKPKAIAALHIKRVERGGSEAEINVTTKELIDIFRSNNFLARYRTSNFVYQVEIKKSKNNKQVAIVNIFKTNNLPDDIKLNEPADFDLNGAKVYLMTPDAIRFKTKEDEKNDTGGASGTGTETGKEKNTTTVPPGTGTETGKEKNTTTVPPGTPVLKRGSRGESVRQLQTLLGLTGGSIDGIYGGETAAWLMIWQEEHKLTADGIYGPKTAAAMEKDPSPVNDQERAKRLAIKLKTQKPPVDTPVPPVPVPPVPVDPGIKTANFYKQLETNFPKIFLGAHTFKLVGGKQGGKQETLYIVNFGDGNQKGTTYEAAIKRNVIGATNTDEDRVLNLFSKLSKQQLTTLLKRYEKINGSKLPLDLKKNAFDESEMTKMENIFFKKGLNLASFMGSGASASF
jgi:peptidoglycan hydrolase-like protein with peptidoglycan-binding domain